MTVDLNQLDAWAREQGGVLAFTATPDDHDDMVEPVIIRLYEGADGIRLDIGRLDGEPARGYLMAPADWRKLLDDPLNIDEYSRTGDDDACP